MSFIQSLYKKFSKSFYNEHILSVKAFLSKTAIETLFRDYKVTRSTKCLPTKLEKNQTISSNTTTGGSWCSAREALINANSIGVPFYKITLSPYNFDKSSLNFDSANPAVCDYLRMFPQPENEMVKSRNNDFGFLYRGKAMKLVNIRLPREESIQVRVLDCNSNTPTQVCHFRHSGSLLYFSRHISTSRSASESLTDAIYKIGDKRTTNLFFLPKVIEEINFCGIKTQSYEAYSLVENCNDLCINLFEEMVSSNSRIHPCFQKTPQNEITTYGKKTLLLKYWEPKTSKKNNLIILLPSGQIFEVIDFPKEDFQELLVNGTFRH